jgi:hypothetical protein
MILKELLAQNGNDLRDEDLAVLADWAAIKVHEVVNPLWRRPYSLLREGADLLLRRRASAGNEKKKTENLTL